MKKTLETIKKILQYHKLMNKGVKIIKVTTTRYYQIPEGTSLETNELLKEWFKDFPVDRRHAFRDSSLLIEHFNDDAKIEEV
jgi:hypothetical protein